MSETAGFGCKFAYGNLDAVFATLTTGWTAVAEATDLSAPEPEAEDIDTTDHDNADKYRTFIAGLRDGGESEVTCHYDKTVFGTLLGLIGTAKKFRLQFSDASGVGWAGYIKKVATEVDMEGLLVMKVSTKVSGAPEAIAAISGGG